MSEAKRRKLMAVPTVYHHTSTLRTNLLWMSGVIEVEGSGEPALHPHFGSINTNANLRRAFEDFPRLAWFTTNINPPQCLVHAQIYFKHKETGEAINLPVLPGLPNAVALQRVAIGFPIASIPVSPWRDHRGYATVEGRALNESAQDLGDNPAEWYVAEQPVDLMQASEFWASPSIMKPKLQRVEEYLLDLKRMVKTARETPGVYIPPSWLKPEQAAELARRIGVPARMADQDILDR